MLFHRFDPAANPNNLVLPFLILDVCKAKVKQRMEAIQ